jgi:hypothetical protein
MGEHHKFQALQIWKNIENTYGEQLTFNYEGNYLVEVNGIDSNINAIDYIDNLITNLGLYREKLEISYGLKKHRKYDIVNLKLSHVYLMLNQIDGLYKIGRSLNPEYREKTLQSQMPSIVKVFISKLTFQGNENKLHRIFSEKRVRGEWFKLTESDIEFIKSFDYGS